MTCEAVSFRGKIGKPGTGKAINLAYVPSLNSWGGLETIQLNIKDWQPAE
jgi:hypothetical protein